MIRTNADLKSDFQPALSVEPQKTHNAWICASSEILWINFELEVTDPFWADPAAAGDWNRTVTLDLTDQLLDQDWGSFILISVFALMRQHEMHNEN